ncbi:hypothetical protein ACHAWF_017161 [Thalassiosira exigua]
MTAGHGAAYLRGGREGLDYPSTVSEPTHQLAVRAMDMSPKQQGPAPQGLDPKRKPSFGSFTMPFSSRTMRCPGAQGHTKRIISLRFFLCAAAAMAFANVFIDFRRHLRRRRVKVPRNDAEMMYNSRLKLEYQCSSKASDVGELISGTEQVIILLPAKVAGTSLKDFSKACNERSYGELGDNFINSGFEHVVTNSFRMPPVIASHINRVENLLYMIENAPRNTLLIYVHREETKRLSSAVSEVVTNWCRRGNGYPDILLEPPKGFFYKEESRNCYVSENKLIDVAIKEKVLEIGLGATELLPCETFEAIKANAPNLLFMDYKNANQLQQLLGKKYCPNLANEPVKSNVASEKDWQAFVRLGHGAKTVTLGSWLEAKRSTLEWALGLHRGATCRAKARIMEDQLFGCESGFLSTLVTEV